MERHDLPQYAVNGQPRPGDRESRFRPPRKDVQRNRGNADEA